MGMGDGVSNCFLVWGVEEVEVKFAPIMLVVTAEAPSSSVLLNLFGCINFAPMPNKSSLDKGGPGANRFNPILFADS